MLKLITLFCLLPATNTHLLSLEFERQAWERFPAYIMDVANGDLNDDGIDDILFVDQANNRLLIFLLDDVGTAELYDEIDLELDNVWRVETADLNSDGNADIVLYESSVGAAFNYLQILLNDGAANFSFTDPIELQMHISDFLVTDMNQDGSADIVASAFHNGEAPLTLFLNNGSGEFVARALTTLARQNIQIAAGDFDDNGFTDIAAGSMLPGGVEILYFKADLEFNVETVLPGSSQMGLLALDIDNDELTDLAVLDLPGLEYARVLRQNSLGELELHSEFAVPGEHSEIASADFDGDGDLDLVTARRKSRRSIAVFSNDGSGTFNDVNQVDDYEYTSPRQNSFKARGLLIQDVDRDGVADIVFADDIPEVAVYRNIPPAYSLNGHVLYNFDRSCNETPASIGRRRQLISVEPGALKLYSDDQGEFRYWLEDGDYVVSVAEPEHWSSDCSAQDLPIKIVDGRNIFQEPLFPMQPTVLFEDVQVSIISGRARPGRKLTYLIHICNSATKLYSGDLELQIDPRLTFWHADLPPDSIDGTRYVWKIGALDIEECRKFFISFEIPSTTEPGEILCANLGAQLQTSEYSGGEYIEEYCLPVTTGFDPNDIQVWPRGSGTEGLISADISTLSYLIRFQNTGNDTTFNVVVLDTLPQGLDVQKLRFGASSHDYSVALLNNSILEISFNDIMLPDSTTDLAGSQGFVKFRIDLEEDLQAGTQIRNRVGIYFDFNPVVLTNTAVTTIAEAITSVDSQLQFSSESLSLYPNPTTEMLKVSNLAAGTQVLEIVDVHGRVVKRIAVDGQVEVSVDCGLMTAGTYFLQTRGLGPARVAKFVVVR